jgi:YebC/PmpR family DNA-binding regulatory protein
MSGHSKWHNIQREKGANDAKKSKLFSKVSRLIMVAAKQGGGNPDSNATLRLAIEKAKEARMPKENIERAIKKGTGEIEGVVFQETVYEGFGPHGGAIVVHCLTDNVNRTVAEIRSIFNKYGGNLGTKGSTSYLFNPETKIPMYMVDLNSEEEAQKVFDFLDLLDENEDVQSVLHNYKLEEED